MDRDFMLRALLLAAKGAGRVSPNPLVGAIIVKDGQVIGEGYHEYFGGKHAEVNALESCKTSPKGGTLYCNLEPCSKNYPGKKNPPCCDAIIRADISRVVIGQVDPNPRVAGSGIAKLRAHGITVETDILLDESLELNRGFNSVMSEGRPYVHIKWAQSLDGQIALDNGCSKWITSEACRKETHLHRSKCDGILVGRRTLEMDNPTLNARYGFTPSPRPIVLDSALKSNPHSKIFTRNPLILCSSSVPKEREALFSGEVNRLEDAPFSISTILSAIKDAGINSLFVEGGSNLITQFLLSGMWDRVTVYTAPKILGSGLSPVAHLGIEHPNQGIEFEESSIDILDKHMVFNGYRRGRAGCLQGS